MSISFLLKSSNQSALRTFDLWPDIFKPKFARSLIDKLM